LFSDKEDYITDNYQIGKEMFDSRFRIFIAVLIAPFMLLTIFCFECKSDTAYFQDTDSESLILANSFWEASFSRTNGSLKYIKDKNSGGIVCYGSKDDSLWAVDFFDVQDVIKSAEYRRGYQKSFTYKWEAGIGTLTFSYDGIPTGAEEIDADVTVKASAENWFEMQLHLYNRYGKTIKFAYFPNDLAFSIPEIEEALYPALPGVIFKKTFFQQKRSYTGRYPGWPGVFADFVALKTINGVLSIYSYQGADRFIPSIFGFLSDEGDADKFHYNHMIASGTENNKDYYSPWIKIRVGDGYVASIDAYRSDNGYDKYMSLKEKLGASYEKIIRSPILKLEATKLKLRFDEYDELIFKIMPSPLIYHFCGFQRGGFDQNLPDILPPESVWGTTEDLIGMVSKLHQRGNLFMPYTNPTWWDDESDTLLNLPSSLTIQDIAVLHEGYRPVYEIYNGYYGGYVTSPYSPFIKEVIAAKMKEITDVVLSDIVFEDQIGARQWRFDFNVNSPTLISYIDGWIEHTRRYKDKILGTELGFDRLAETETAFYGGMLLSIRDGTIVTIWGAGNLSAYPMISILLRDKVMLYQHDLADYTMTLFKENFSWNLAFGYFPTMQIVSRTSMNIEWMKMLSGFSKYVLSRYAGERARDFSYLTDNLSKTDFENFEVFANWSEDYPCAVDEHSVAPMGAIVRSKAGNLTAGIFTAYNGIPLAGKEQYIIEERTSDSIMIRHLMGEATTFAVMPLANWKTTDRLIIRMSLSNGAASITIPCSIEGSRIVINLSGEINGLRAETYLIVQDKTNPGKRLRPVPEHTP
jgi:hypothetical protein